MLTLQHLPAFAVPRRGSARSLGARAWRRARVVAGMSRRRYSDSAIAGSPRNAASIAAATVPL